MFNIVYVIQYNTSSSLNTFQCQIVINMTFGLNSNLDNDLMLSLSISNVPRCSTSMHICIVPFSMFHFVLYSAVLAVRKDSMTNVEL